jgi:hypothetical protein
MADGIKARIGTVWKDLTPSIKVGAAWKTPDAVHVKVGGVWKKIWNALSVQLTAQNLVRLVNQTCYSGIKIASDGNIWTKDAAGSNTWTDSGDDWLLAGANTEVWVMATWLTGTGSPSLISSSAVNTRLACTTDRLWMIRDTVDGGGEVTGTLDLFLYDAATGGNLLTSRSYALDAEYLFFG